MDRTVRGYVFRDSLEGFSQGGRLTSNPLKVYNEGILEILVVGKNLEPRELVAVQITFQVKEETNGKPEEQAVAG